MRRRNVARVVAAGALALSLAACGADQYMEDLAVSQSGTDEEYQVRKNPLVEVDTAQDAAKGAGFDGFSDGAASIARLGDTYQEYFITSPGHCSAEIVYEGPNVDIAVHTRACATPTSSPRSTTTSSTTTVASTPTHGPRRSAT